MTSPDLPVHARLRLWSPLASHEVPAIANTLSERESQLKATESCIMLLEREISQLRNQRDDLRRDIDARRSLFAPIRSLPLELLSEIFSITEISIEYLERREPIIYEDKPNDFDEHQTVSYSTVDATPAVLSQVCSTWNNLLSNSTLPWSNISLHISSAEIQAPRHTSVRDMRTVENALTYVLGRSKDSPLYVTLGCFQYGFEPMKAELGSVLVRLLSQCHRWKTADVCFDLEHSEYQFLTRLSDPMPALEALSFSLDYRSNVDGAVKSKDFFCQTPALRTVTFASPKAFQQSTITWAGLHSFSVYARGFSDFYSISHIINVLSQCNALRSLAWYGDFLGSHENTHPVILPITSLKGNSNLQSLLPHVLLPDMKTFHLIVPHATLFNHILSHYLRTYWDVITALHVPYEMHSKGTSVETMFTQLGSFPALQSLELCHRALDGPACHFDKIRDRFPKLEKLSYTIWETVTSSILRDVLSLLKAFGQPVGEGISAYVFPVLQRVHLKFPSVSLDDEHCSMLRSIEATELHLEVRDKNGLVNFHPVRPKVK